MTAEAYAAFYADGWYRRLVAVYEQRATDFTRTQARQVAYGQDLARWCPQVPGVGPMLDAGGSTGAVADGWSEIKGTRPAVTVLDPSADELALAAQRGYQTIQGTLETGPQETRWLFPLILCAQTIDHVQDPLLALRRLRVVVAPEGWLVLDYVACEPIVTGSGLAHVPQLSLKIDHPCYWTKAAIHRWHVARRHLRRRSVHRWP
jgi:ubiquinone/menaquinone biosynthesis C-methylase UbiE